MKDGLGLDVERRRLIFPWDVVLEERAEGLPKLVGHAAVFNEIADIGWFRERINPGAFRKTIKESEIKALWNHNDDIVLGSTSAKTLRLAEDEVGLAIEIDPPSWASGYVETIRRGDVKQMSIGFQVIREEVEEEDQDQPLRTLKEIRLFDVSPVAFPAYPQTDVSVRKLLRESGIDLDRVEAIWARQQYGLALRDADHETVRAVIDALQKLLPAAPSQETHPAEPTAEIQACLQRKRLLLELKEKL